MPPPQLPAELADLLDRTLGPDGLPGVLADWLDEHSPDWGPLTEALRASRPYDPAAFRGTDGFAYRPAGPGVLVWLARVYHEGTDYRNPTWEYLIGVYRHPPAPAAAWRRVVSADALPKAARRALWGLFLLPPGAAPIEPPDPPG